MPNEIIKSLSASELSKLDQLETLIESGMKTFAQVGGALAAIRDSRLYREQFKTFEEYCSERWGMKRARAYQLIDAAEVVKNLSTIVDKPTNEAQSRPLAKLPAADQPKAWNAATAFAESQSRPVTAKDVERAAAEVSAPVASRPARQSTAMLCAAAAIGEMRKIRNDDPARHEAFATLGAWIHDNE